MVDASVLQRVRDGQVLWHYGPRPSQVRGRTKVAIRNTARAAAPISPAYTPLFQQKGAVKVTAAQVAEISSFSFQYTNAMQGLEAVRPDGLLDDVDAGVFLASGQITQRLSHSKTLRDPGNNEAPVALDLEIVVPGGRHKITFSMPRTFLSNPGKPIDGPAGLQQTPDWRAAHDTTAGHMCEVVLINDVANY